MRPAKKLKLEWESTDAVLWDPRQLVGKQLRVLWPTENRYFPGTVVSFNASTFEHEIHYDDGDEEKIVLATEKLQMLPNCLRRLSAPSPAYLDGLARRLDALADELEVKAVQQRTARGRTVLKEDDRQKLETLRRRSFEVRVARDRLEHGARRDSSQQQHVPSGSAARLRSTNPNSCARSPGRGAAAVSASAAAPSSHSPGRHLTCMGSVGAHIRAKTSGPGPRGTPETVVPPNRALRSSGRGQTGPGDGAELKSPALTCSPAGAKRRNQQQEEQQGQRQPDQGQALQPDSCEPEGREATLCDAARAYPLATSSFPSSSLAAASAGARGSELGGSDLAVDGWGAKGSGGRGKRVLDAGAGGGLGRLYVPRPWLALHSSACSSSNNTVPTRCAAASESAQTADGSAADPDRQLLQLDPLQNGAQAGGADKAAGGSGGNGNGGRVSRGSSEDDRRAAELRAAYKHFRQSCSAFKQYHELQVALWLSPEQLVGREIRVLWPDEEAWFCGRVTQMDPVAGTHTVEYDDGDVEHLHLAAEEVRLQVVPGEAEILAPRPPEELQRVAACMSADAMRLRQRAKELREGPPRPGKRPKSTQEGAKEDAEDLLSKAERLATRAAELQSVAAALQREAAISRPAGPACGAERPGSHVGARKALEPIAEEPAAAAEEPAAAAAQTTAAGEPSGRDGGAGSAATRLPVGDVPDGLPTAVSLPMNVDTANRGRAGDGLEAQMPSSACPEPQSLGARGDPDNVSGSVGIDSGGSIRDAGTSGSAAADPSPPEDWAEEQQVLRPGEVVWAQVRRTRPWPAMVITREEAEREGLSMSQLGSAQRVFVRFFGDCSVCALKPASIDKRASDRRGVVAFLAGLELGWHANKWAERSGAASAAAPGSLGLPTQRFLRALFELRTYMMEGELPRGMIPPNHDEDDDEEAVETHAGQAAGAHASDKAARGGSVATAGTATAIGISLPWAVSPKLQVLHIGEVVWLSRWFHDEKYIYPVGYCAARLMASGASGGKEVPHVMEVTASEDGVRPVFRITPEGCTAVEADTASKAMRALFQDDARTSGRAFAKTGADLFGLSIPRVAALVRSLPGAERCESFANWPDQEKPPVPPLTPYEEVQRRALYARALRLPSGVTALPQAKPGMCFECEVCGEAEESAEDLLLECDLCRCVVHSRCYGVEQPPNGGMWLCDVCQLHAAGLPADRAPPCDLCPVAGGPMKRTDAGGYVHLLCAVWTPGVAFGDEQLLEPVEGVAKVVQARLSLRCCLCKQSHGACIQCPGPRCYTAFHPMCAREAGLAMCELRPSGSWQGSLSPRRHHHHKQRSLPTATRTAAAGAPERHFSRSASSDPTGGADLETDLGKENKPAIANGAAVGVKREPADGVSAAGGKIDTEPLHKPCAGAGEGPSTAPEAGPGAEEADFKADGTVLGPDAEAAAAVALAAAAPFSSARRSGRGVRGRFCRSGSSSADSAACLSATLQRSGITLACFCPRHEDLVLRAPQFRTAFQGGRFAERRAELTREQLRQRRQRLLQEHELSEQPPAAGPQDQGQARAQPCPSKDAEAAVRQQHQQQATEASLQSAPFGSAASGGAGASSGDVAEAGAGGDQEPATGRAMSFADWRSRGQRAPEAVASAREKRTYIKQLPYLVTSRRGRVDEAEMEALRAACSVRDVGPGEQLVAGGPVGLRQADGPVPRVAAALQPPAASCPAVGTGPLVAETRGGGDGGAGGGTKLPVELTAAAAAAGARSVAERYRAMKATVSRRLAVGKSAIHGWGAFAKVAHKRGDMVIEYVGELIRPIVSDVREMRTYDKLVGSGTYIFNLNDHEHIDATRAGNMAHLLNHSCEPNCYSRTITLWEPALGTTRDHVVIVAKRDIRPWEELTYDYRFNSAVDLPCNCGAASCRLLVNWPEEEHEEWGEGDAPKEGKDPEVASDG